MQRALMALAATLAMSACGEDGSGLRCTNHSHLTFDFITGMRGVIVVR